MLKKITYISLFVLLGIIVSFLIHAIIEIVVIDLLLDDFDKFGFGFDWSQWFLFHSIGSIFLFVLGALFGYAQGRYWWRVIYVQKRFRKK